MGARSSDRASDASRGRRRAPLLGVGAGGGLAYGLAWLLAGALACGPDPAPRIENVLLILVEDQGAHLGRLGTPGLETPHLDALAAEGVLLREAFVASPVCSPSKAALYTGRHPHANGLMANTVDYMRPAGELSAEQRRHPFYALLRVDPGVPTLIEVLHEAGLFTGVTGKLHVAPNEKFPFDRFLHTRGRTGAGPAAVASFLAEATAAGRPWMLVHSVRPPHRPYPDSEQEAIGVPFDAVRPPAFLPDTAVVRRDWAEYLAAIERADAEVGAALAALDASGEAERTLVVFTSDHGPAFQRGKTSLYDLGLRVPLIVRGPGIAQGVVSDARVSAVDLMPTLLELLALPAPAGLQGRSFARALAQDARDRDAGRELVFAELGHGIPRPERGLQERSVYDGRFHLIYRDRPALPRIVNADLRRAPKWRNRTYDETVRQRARFPEAFRILSEIDNARLGGRPPRVELYDLSADPDEMNDLASDPAHRETLKRLMDALRAWAQRTGDDAVLLPAARADAEASPASPAGASAGATPSLREDSGAPVRQ